VKKKEYPKHNKKLQAIGIKRGPGVNTLRKGIKSKGANTEQMGTGGFCSRRREQRRYWGVGIGGDWISVRRIQTDEK